MARVEGKLLCDDGTEIKFLIDQDGQMFVHSDCPKDRRAWAWTAVSDMARGLDLGDGLYEGEEA